MNATKVGDRVMIDSADGFGGPARIVAIRPVPGSRFQVRMDDANPAAPFWAHDFEVTFPTDSRLEPRKEGDE